MSTSSTFLYLTPLLLFLSLHTLAQDTSSSTPPPSATVATPSSTTPSPATSPTTTPSPATSPTTTPSTTSPSTATPLTASTTSTPPRYASKVDVFNVCACDLRPGLCDVNCCCDRADCSAHAVSVFRECEDFVPTYDDRYCYPQLPVVFENGEYFNVTRTSGGLFCIVVDNYRDRNYYVERDVAGSDDDYKHYYDPEGGGSYPPLLTREAAAFISRYKGRRYQEPRGGAAGVGTSQHYLSGDPVLVKYSAGICDVLRLPSPSSRGGRCVTPRAVRMLEAGAWACTRTSPSCLGDPALSAEFYHRSISVITSPVHLLGTTHNTSATPQVPPDEESNSTAPPPLTLDDSVCFGGELDSEITRDTFVAINVTCAGAAPCRLPARPSLSGDVCHHLVTSARYTVVVNSTGAITSVSLRLRLSNVSLTDLERLTQHFSIHYEWLENDAHVVAAPARSGNPGYIVGKPVILGYHDLTTNGFTLPQGLEGSLSLMVSAADSRCENRRRRPVGFGRNFFSGCLFRVDISSFSTSCSRIQGEILAILLDTNISTVDVLHVAAFGNSPRNDSYQWVKVLLERSTELILDVEDEGGGDPGRPPVCPHLCLGLDVEILWASVGSVDKPQSKIVGVKYKLWPTQRVELSCVGIQCSHGSDYHQYLEIHNSITFRDVSEPAVTIAAEMPQLETKLPYDFFHPFFLSHASRVISYPSAIMSVLLLFLYPIINSALI